MPVPLTLSVPTCADVCCYVQVTWSLHVYVCLSRCLVAVTVAVVVATVAVVVAVPGLSICLPL